MNKILGFFKEKITEVKEQNKQEFQTIAQAFNENQYSRDKVLGMLQSAKSNYMNWNILIANEASTGLYYTQTHNRNICVKKIQGNEEIGKKIQRNKIKLQQIERTHKELSNISELNGKWVSSMSSSVDSMAQCLSRKCINTQNSQENNDKLKKEKPENLKRIQKEQYILDQDVDESIDEEDIEIQEQQGQEDEENF